MDPYAMYAMYVSYAMYACMCTYHRACTYAMYAIYVHIAHDLCYIAHIEHVHIYKGLLTAARLLSLLNSKKTNRLLKHALRLEIFSMNKKKELQMCQ